MELNSVEIPVVGGDKEVNQGGHCLICGEITEAVLKFGDWEEDEIHQVLGYLVGDSAGEELRGLLESVVKLEPPICEKCYGDFLEELGNRHKELRRIQRGIARKVEEIRGVIKERRKEVTMEGERRLRGTTVKELEVVNTLTHFQNCVLSKDGGVVVFPSVAIHPGITEEDTEEVPSPTSDPESVETAPDNNPNVSTDATQTENEVESPPCAKSAEVQLEFITIEEYTDNTSQVFVTPVMATGEQHQITMEIPVGQDNLSAEGGVIIGASQSMEVVLSEEEEETSVTEKGAGGAEEPETEKAGAAEEIAVNVGGVPVDPTANFVMLTTNVTDPTTGSVTVQPILISVAQLQTMQQQQVPEPIIQSVTSAPPSKKRCLTKNAYCTPSEYVYFNEDVQPCDVCNARIPRGSEVASHLATHVGSDYVYYCSDCQLGFISPFRLDRYHQSKSIRCRLDTSPISGSVLTCDHCDYQVDKMVPFKKHLDTHENTEGLQKSLQCPLCPLRFTGKRRLDVHLDEKHVFTKPSGRQKCDVCGSFFDLGEMESHLWSHGITEILRCKLCMCLFSSVDSILEHQAISKRRAIHDISCHVCGSRFIKARDLRLHCYNEHRLGTKYKCDQCQGELYSLKSFQSHQEKCQGVNEETDSATKNTRSYPASTRKLCPECGMSFSTADILLKHRIRNHDHPPVPCTRSDCQQTFTSEQERKTHIAQDHQGFVLIKNPYSCDLCGAQFPKKDKLKKHKFVKHSSAKPYSCQVCSLTYRNKKTLDDHVKLKHFGEKKKKTKVCDVCQRAFADGQVLKQHKLIHTNERPWECGQCGQKFRQKAAWRTHEKSHDKLGTAFKPKGEMERKGDKEKSSAT